MKSQRTVDRRLVSQLVVLALLTALPVAMIAINGARAVRAILTPISKSYDRGIDTSKEAAASVGHSTGNTALRFGIYDPDGVFASEKTLKLRHIYVSWAAFDQTKLKNELASLERQDFEVLLTIEPWPVEGSELPLLSTILEGDYDPIIDDLAAVLQGLEGPVYLSWGHEMDQDMTERYPWSNTDPEQFVAAYRHVVDRIRAHVDTTMYWIWAGVLKDGSLRYWPGSEYADYIGMPIYSFPAWDQKTYGFIRDFQTTFEEKREVVAELNMPLFITELGVSGSGDFDSYWLHQAFMALNDYPDLVGVIFFYARDHEGAWGTDLGAPDWRVHPESIRGLVRWNLRTGHVVAD